MSMAVMRQSFKIVAVVVDDDGAANIASLKHATCTMALTHRTQIVVVDDLVWVSSSHATCQALRMADRARDANRVDGGWIRHDVTKACVALDDTSTLIPLSCWTMSCRSSSDTSMVVVVVTLLVLEVPDSTVTRKVLIARDAGIKYLCGSQVAKKRSIDNASLLVKWSSSSSVAVVLLEVLLLLAAINRLGASNPMTTSGCESVLSFGRMDFGLLATSSSSSSESASFKSYNNPFVTSRCSRCSCCVSFMMLALCLM
mmetsp:Transcript_25153/g.41744  ORF Transcript_25153/g.41744 Transcript_25153/m.41744 type:complete len:257 (+) Transcript_25153:309-1079(+)